MLPGPSPWYVAHLGRPAMKTIQLNPAQRQDLRRRCKLTRDKRIYQRLTAVLLVDAGKTRSEVADILHLSLRQVADWLRIFRNKGVDQLTTLHYRGDPGKLSPSQVEQLKEQIRQGRFRNSNQIRSWLEETFGVPYASSGV